MTQRFQNWYWCWVQAINLKWQTNLRVFRQISSNSWFLVDFIQIKFEPRLRCPRAGLGLLTNVVLETRNFALVWFFFLLSFLHRLGDTHFSYTQRRFIDNIFEYISKVGCSKGNRNLYAGLVRSINTIVFSYLKPVKRETFALNSSDCSGSHF